MDVTAPFFEIHDHDAAGMDVIFYGERGRTFDLETTRLLSAPWTLLQTQPMTNVFLEFRVTVPPGDARFLRARERQ